MKIGIDASRAFIKQRTGIEEYSYQVIKHLRNKLDNHEVILYVRKWNSSKIDFELPSKWKTKKIPYVYGWTQVGLALEMLLDPIDIFFSPAHTTAIIHPKKTIVVIHGLEYEHCPKSYSMYARWFHRFFIKRSCKWATKVIAVSENTKKDLTKMYNVSKSKIAVIYNGFNNSRHQIEKKSSRKSPYLFYVGRIEERKNIIGIVRAFNILKKKYNYNGKLILAGSFGIGGEEIQKEIAKSEYKQDVEMLGFISEKEKWSFLEHADVFLFPSFCEGFGIPIVEAQSVGVPVVTSSIGPMDEISGNKDICVDPSNEMEIATKVNSLIKDQDVRNDVIEKGRINIQRFSWEECATKISVEIKKCFEG